MSADKNQKLFQKLNVGCIKPKGGTMQLILRILFVYQDSSIFQNFVERDAYKKNATKTVALFALDDRKQ